MSTKIFRSCRRFLKRGQERPGPQKKHLITKGMVMTILPAMALAFGVSLATAQEPGELVELALPAPMGSLKTVPLMRELVQMLENPYVAPTRRPSFLPQPLPPLRVHPLSLNPLTVQPMALLFDPAAGESEISWNIPSLDNATFPFLAPLVGNLAVNPVTGLLQRADPAGVLADIPAGTPGAPALDIPVNETDFYRPGSDTAGVPAALSPYVGRLGAETLGKSLFWDMQVGSDGVQACGTCHFNAGVDNRTKNQLNPNHLGGDFTLQVVGPNQEVLASDFPFHKLANLDIPGEPLLNPGNVVSDANDIMSSMGVRFRRFRNIRAIGASSFGPAVLGVSPLLPDLGFAEPDPIPNAFIDPLTGENLRRVEPRNTPTMQGAAFNFDNFWDGRARFHFNGGSVHGPADPQNHVFIDPGAPNGAGGSLTAATNRRVRPDLYPASPDPADPANQPPRIKFSSLASQAVGPPLSDFEMSFAGRNWPKIGKKLLQAGVTPLANQLVATGDSRLGPFSNQGGSVCTDLGRPTAVGMPGLCTTYEELIQLAFKRQYWQNTNRHLVGCYTDGRTPACDPAITPDPFDGFVLRNAGGPAVPTSRNHFRQSEANFSLFFGLAVQAYEEILIPDDTPFDQFLDANPNQFLGTGFLTNPNVGLTPNQLHGFDLFVGTNHSGQNPFFKVARCGLCHNGPEMTDHSNVANHALVLPDAITGIPRVISGFLLEEEIGESAQDAVELDNISMGIDLNDLVTPTFGQDINGHPTGHTMLDNGIYNIGVRPIANDIGRGGLDPFNFPLSLATLALDNAGLSEGVATPAPAYTITPLTEIQRDPLTGAPILDPVTGLPITLPAGIDLAFTPQLPPYLAPWANDFTVGEAWPFIDRTVFNPDTADPNIALAAGLLQGTYPNPNRVGKMGNFKAPSLRNVELSGPYFHTGSFLTLRQVVDFYGRGGDFPATNTLHRDPNILNLNVNFFSQLTESDKVALVDFLLALTDDRVKFDRAPFDHPEIFVPEDGTAPDNTGGRAALLTDPTFRQVTQVGAGGRVNPLPAFMGVTNNPAADCVTEISHFCR